MHKVEVAQEVSLSRTHAERFYMVLGRASTVITRESWFDFIRSFFGISASDRWLDHVVSNWNFSLNQPGCGCSFYFFNGSNYSFCQDFINMQESRVDEDDTTD